MHATRISARGTRITGKDTEALIHEDSVKAFVPYPLPPTEPELRLDDALHRLLAQANHALGKLDGVAALSAQPDLDLLIYSYARKEAVLSSQIEGAQSSLSELLLFEVEQAPGVPIDDVRETLNYLHALDAGIAKVRTGELPISNRLIRDAHGQLLASTRGSSKLPGDFRRSNVWLGGVRPRDARFVPPPWQEVQSLMGELEKFINDEEPIGPLVKAALAHAQFETIHPFLDGNGRVGRLLVALILSVEGVLEQPMLYLSLYFKQHRDLYYDALQRVRTEGDWEGWIRFFLGGVIEVSNDAVGTAKRIISLVENDRGKVLTLSRAASATPLVFEYASRKVFVSPGRVSAELDISQSSTNAAIMRLADAGILYEITGKKRNRLFCYSEYLAILNEGAQPL
ncbi:MAG: Fic family protein [Solirubrobacterales bacterium]